MNWLERLNRADSTIALDDLGTAQVLHWAYSPALPSNVPHRHTYFEVCLVGERGSGTFHVQGDSTPLAPGTVFFARPGIVHQIRSDPDAPLELFWVSFQVLPTGKGTELLEPFLRSRRAAALDNDGRLQAVWKALRAAAACPRSGLGDVQMRVLMTALLLGLIQAGTMDTPADALPSAHAALSYIHDHLTRALSVDEVAQHLNLSPRHLTRLVRDLTGLAPAAYIETARLTRARFLLLRTDDPLKQIAAQVGYGSVQHFTRAFTRTYGCPPGRFRASRGTASQRLLAATPENIGQHV